MFYVYVLSYFILELHLAQVETVDSWCWLVMFTSCSFIILVFHLDFLASRFSLFIHYFHTYISCHISISCQVVLEDFYDVRFCPISMFLYIFHVQTILLGYLATLRLYLLATFTYHIQNPILDLYLESLCIQFCHVCMSNASTSLSLHLVAYYTMLIAF